MKRQLTTFVIAIITSLMPLTATAQNKFDARLNLIMRNDSTTKTNSTKSTRSANQEKTLRGDAPNEFNITYNEKGEIECLVVIATIDENEEWPLEEMEKAGIDIRCIVGKMATLTVTPNQLQSLSSLKSIKSIHADKKLRRRNNRTRSVTGVDVLHGAKEISGSNLPQQYKGKGVILGVVDAGIDFNHVAFRDPVLGTTRLAEALTYTSSKSNARMTRYTGEAINQLKTDDKEDSHGTHTSATAGGSYAGKIEYENGKYASVEGMAPESELILAGAGVLYNSRIIECVKEIVDYADKAGKPCVVSISLGSYLTWHDGYDELAYTYNTLTQSGEKKGLVIATAAGNSGDVKSGICKTFSSDNDSLMTCVTYDEAGFNNVLYYDGADIMVTSDSNTPLDITPVWINISTGKYEKWNSTKIAQTCYSKVESTNNRWYWELYSTKELYSSSPYMVLGLIVKGKEGQTARLMVESPSDYTSEFSDYDLSGLTNGTTAYSVDGDPCTDGVISVGSWNATATFYNARLAKSYSYPGEKKDDVTSWSSYGIDDNGIARPDVLAPGTGIISAGNLYNSEYIDQNTFNPVSSNIYVTTVSNVNIGDYSRKNPWEVMQGTSMSTPAVSGIIALWLQANPNLSVKSVREVLQQTSTKDAFTNASEATILQSGVGKIDALAGMQYILQNTSLDIEVIENSNEDLLSGTADAIYSVTGQKIPNLQKGLNIVRFTNGKTKKIFVK